MRRLKMLTTGPNRNYRRGSIVEVDDQRAEKLIEGKHAVEVREVADDGDSERTEELQAVR